MSNKLAPVAQLEEQRPSEPRVGGSSPSGRAKLRTLRVGFTFASLRLAKMYSPGEAWRGWRNWQTRRT